MNVGLKSGNLFSIVAVAATTGLALAWLFDLGLGTAGWMVRLVLLGACLALTGLSVGMIVRRANSTQRAVRRSIDTLCQLKPHDLAGNEIPPAVWAALRRNSRWDDTFNRLRGCFVSYGERLQQAEHSRARAEVRARHTHVERQQMSEILAGLAEPILAIDHYGELVLRTRHKE